MSVVSALKELTEEAFSQKVLASEIKFSLVMFSASWCAPCQRMIPTLEAFADKVGENLALYKADVEQLPMFTEMFNIRSLPTFLLFHRGEEVRRRVGSGGLQELIDFCGEAIVG